MQYVRSLFGAAAGRPTLWALLALAAIGALPWASPARAETSVATFVVHHQSQGDIGTQTLRITREGDRTVVEIRLTILVRVLGVVVHRQEQIQTEVLQKGRLISFDGLDVENGKRSTVRGRAEGDKFVILTKTGQRIEAPAEIRTTFPWSPEFAKFPLQMGAGSGELNRVQIALVGATTLSLDGKSVPAVLYRVSGDYNRDVWFSPDGELLQFRFLNDNVPVTFRRKL